MDEATFSSAAQTPPASSTAGGVDAMVEKALRRERMVVGLALTLVVVLAWLYVLAGAGMGMSALDMTHASQRAFTAAAAGASQPSMTTAPVAGMEGMARVSWSFSHALVMFLMWWIMMLAMMLPSAAPMILLFAAINRKQRARGNPYVSTSLFTGAYLAIWGGFSVLAVTLQWALQSIGWLSPILVSNNAALGGALLVLAGIYQLTPIKQACLRHCRSPVAFISEHWRNGRRGAFNMGTRHGAYCVGCCWFLMGLLFLGGVMNLWWVVGLALFVLLEKLGPAGDGVRRLSGVVLIGFGIWMLIPKL